ncbi:HAD family hydrolase [Actinoalloteichus sp. AHMU CJ021]|uniref:HAD-IIA family hydrolase n=1 Tax=Actinoalloteichus TaxID=65496 RepID=UPI00040F019F|nr:HAD-IIA family hydrolase [Actinoalloteichus caeruleus]AUS77669.1 HAD family hydrolase [Actinoalloteichus sp. AHMU CJ021]
MTEAGDPGPDYLDRYDALLLDLDGTVYQGREAVPGAVDALRAASARGTRFRYVTNNAARPPEAVAEHLVELGFAAAPAEVSTSAQAGASVLAERLAPGSTVAVVGTEALRAEVSAVGLRPVRAGELDDPGSAVAVVQGHSPETGWRDLAAACRVIRGGGLWVACNLDPTVPTDVGQLPGNGSMVAALRTATGAEPLVAGKPRRPLFDQAVRGAGFRRPLVVGDRLDTDIAGARNAGLASLLVLSGVCTGRDLLACVEEERPDHVAWDLAALHAPHAHGALPRGESPVDADGPAGAWVVERSAEPGAEGRLVVRHAGGAHAPSSLGLLLALCAAWWPVGGDPGAVVAVDDSSAAALRALRVPVVGD